MELNIYQKTEKHAHSLFFNRIAVKKNFQKVLDRNKFTLVAFNSNFEVMDNALKFQIREG